MVEHNTRKRRGRGGRGTRQSRYEVNRANPRARRPQSAPDEAAASLAPANAGQEHTRAVTRARRQPRVSRKERGRDAHRACTSQGRGEGSARKGDKEGRGGRWTAKRGGAIWRARRPTSPPRRALGGEARGGEWDRWGGRCAVVGQLQNDQGTDRSRVWRPYEVRKPAGPRSLRGAEVQGLGGGAPRGWRRAGW